MNSSVLRTWLAASIVLMCTFAFAQPTAVIKVQGYSPQDIVDLGWTSPRSTGLSNVGVGQLVYLVGSASDNAAVVSFAWSLTNPAGSNAVLDSTDKWQTTFKPDVVGKFTVQLVITTAGGTSAPVTATINAAKYVGVGGMDGLPVAYPQCAIGCHSLNVTEWTNTGHASMFSRGIDGILSDHYGENCIECHTTGYDGDPTTGNDGFDDVQAELGWVFPTTLQAGNWESMKTNYQKLAQRGNIQCESCHGPGSAHAGDPAGTAMDIDASLCGYCHDSGSHHIKNAQWKASVHGNPTTDRSNSTTCAPCHSGWGFIARIDPDAAFASKRPTLGVNQVTCAVCHDPHNAANEHQVRTEADVTLMNGEVITAGGLGKLCMNCHMARTDAVSYTDNPANLSTRFGPHHSNQADMLAGTNAIDYGIPIGSSGHKFAAAEACVTCHMALTPAAGEPGNNKVGEHTFSVKWDGGTPDDPSDDVENVGKCQECHGASINSFDDILAKADFDQDGTIEGTRQEVEGLVEKLDLLLPARTNNTVISDNYDWTKAGLTPEEVTKRKAYAKAWYNLVFVEEDRSMGVHNAGYAIALLTRSIASITTGAVGAVAILPPIKDVPNDQGKQVRVTWSKAAGDGISTNPVTGYSLWRRLDGQAGAMATEVASKEAMLAKGSEANVGGRFSIAQEGSWDFVAWVPAAGFEFYSVVAPTLFDSTAADGIRWSYFFVAAHAGSQIYESAPDSGYSMDNLAPFVPGNVAGNVAAGRVSLKWDDPIDADFQYFAIYRSTSSGFDPKNTTPIAKLTGTEYTDNDVTLGSTYYYRLSAFDFAGNESDFTPELPLSVTSVNQNVTLPTVFALEQNYPNPFNPETAIRYQLAKSGHVKLSIYTALGQEVRRLVDRNQSAAYHVAVWDGRDDAGNVMPSGVYFYRIDSESFSAIKKMIMMK